MAIGNRQIGWSQEDNLLWEISKQLDRMNSVLCTGPCPTSSTTSTTTTAELTTTTTTTIPLVNTDNLFEDCNQPCGAACGGGIPIYYNVWMTQECIDTFPTIGCAIYKNDDPANPFDDGTYNIGNGDCIVITGGIITDILT